MPADMFTVGPISYWSAAAIIVAVPSSRLSPLWTGIMCEGRSRAYLCLYAVAWTLPFDTTVREFFSLQALSISLTRCRIPRKSQRRRWVKRAATASPVWRGKTRTERRAAPSGAPYAAAWSAPRPGRPASLTRRRAASTEC